jgi:hypothetical protein
MNNPLSETSPLSMVDEQDIDLMLLEELCVSPSFRSWLVETLFGGNLEVGEFQGAWHSVTDPSGGESDLILAFIPPGRDRVTALLIENKIDAPFQPRQDEQYRERGERGRDVGLWHDFHTCLIAPRKYLETNRDVAFDRRITYEEIASWFAAQPEDARYEMREDLLRGAIERSRLG